MAFITLSFIEKYFSRPPGSLRSIGGRSEAYTVLPDAADAYRDIVRQASDAYARFNYPRTVALLERVLRSLASNPLREPASHRDNDAEHQLLAASRDAVQLYERAANWLGIRSVFDGFREGRAYEILGDLDQIDSRLGYAPSTESTRAFRQQQLGEYGKAKESIERGLSFIGNKSTERALVEVKANMALRLGHFDGATQLYGRLSAIDESIAIPADSQGLAVAFRGIAMLLARKDSVRGLALASEGLRACSESSHFGFGVQIKEALVSVFVERNECDAASEILSSLPQLVIPAYSGWQSRETRLATFIEGLSRSGRALGTVSAAEAWIIERLPAVGVAVRSSWEPLRHAFRSILKALVVRDLVAAKVWIVQAVELVTKGLLERHGLPSRRTLAEKNRALFLAGVYGHPEKNIIDELRAVRNSLVHGEPESLQVNQVARLLDVFLAFHCLCELVFLNDLHGYQPSESADRRALRAFLGPM